MRKALVILCAAALVLAFALPAMAQKAPIKPGVPPRAPGYLGKVDFKFRGDYWFIGGTLDNTSDFNKDSHDAVRAVVQRYRWWFDASIDDKYGGTIGLEWNWTWGQDAGSTVKNPLGAWPTGAGGAHGQDQTDVTRLNHAYIWFLVPGTPVKVTSGLQNFTVDPDNFVFDGSDWFGIKVQVPVIKGMFNVEASWMADDEGSSRNFDSDETDYYVLNLTGALTKEITGGFYNVWGHVRHNGAVTLGAGRTSFVAGSNPFAALGAPGYTEGDYLWHGIYANYISKQFYGRLHFNYLHANIDDQGTALDPDLSGWALHGRAGVALGPTHVGLRGWYFTGNDDDAADATDPEYNRWVAPDSFFVPLEILYRGARDWWLSAANYQHPGGSWGLALEADWQVTKKLVLDLIAAYVGATDKEDKLRSAGATSTYRSGVNDNNDKDLGIEVNLRATYKIYSALSLDLVAAYLFAGDGLDFADGAGGFESADDAYEIFYRLRFRY
jgi:hypothetical protein